MGKEPKAVQEQPSDVPLPNNSSPGCMWKVLHHINQHKWLHARKRLANKGHESSKHPTVVVDPGSKPSTSSAGDTLENMNVSSVEGNLTESSPVPKSSKRSRIKALITDQVKRRGRHRRSLSDPQRKQQGRTASIHNLEVSDENPSAKNVSNSENMGSQENGQSSISSSQSRQTEVNKQWKLPVPKIGSNSENMGNQDNGQSSISSSHSRQTEVNKQWKPPVPKIGSKNENMGNQDNGKSSISCRETEVNKQWKPPVAVRVNALLQSRLMHEMEPSKYASAQESKLFLDALDLLNMREELFVKILQDPNCSFANQLQGRRRSNLKFGLTKSVSFPAAGSSGEGNDENDKSNHIAKEDNKEASAKDPNEHLLTSRGSFTEDGKRKSIPPCSPLSLKKRHEHTVVIKRFKNLREKLKHAIWESKNEKHRIVMDAVLHKVPYGRRPSNEGMEDNTHVHRSSQQDMKRTSSFNELDRYSRLMEISFSREERNHRGSEELRLRTRGPSPVGTKSATLGRILSLPDLRSYSYFPSEDSPDSSSQNVPFHNPSANVSVVSNQPDEQTLSGQDLETKIQSDAISESETQGFPLDIGINLVTTNRASSHDGDSASCSSQVENQIEVSEHDYQEDETGPENPMSMIEDLRSNLISPAGEDCLADQLQVPTSDYSTILENPVDIKTLESRVKQYYEKLFYIQEEIKNKAEFNFVRDVLVLSGFSESETLGNWYSAEQPVDPAVFDEIEMFLIVRPDCHVYEEGDCCDHLLLFDLINEVLLDIYERSFSYWQKPLTCQSHIHRMPFGHHVLDEVWAEISWYLNWKPEIFLTLDDAVSRDLSIVDGWMNLQFDAELVGLEMEDLIFDELLDELIFE